MKLGNVELKVAVPLVATALTGTLGAAAYRTVLAFGWFHPTAQETISLAALGAALLVVVQGVSGYVAPHTSRPDLADPSGLPEQISAARPEDPAPTPIPAPAPTPTPVPSPVQPPTLPADAYPDTPPAAGGSVQVTPVPFPAQETS